MPAFVHHRITEIRSKLPTAEWRYCPTLENPADLLIRGIDAEPLLSSTLWKNGPTWLTTADKRPLFDQPLLPPLLVAAAVATDFIPADSTIPTNDLHCVILLDRYSTLNKLLRVTAYAFRFIDNLRTQPDQ